MVEDLTFKRRDFLGLGLAGFDFVSFGSCAGSAKAIQEIKVVTGAGSTSLVVIELMNRLRLPEKFGAQAKITSMTDGARSMSALVSGDADICVGQGFAPVLTAIERGGSFKLLAAVSFPPQTAVLSSKPEINKVKDLVGKTVGVGSLGSLDYELMVALLQKKGIDPASVTFANVGASPDIFRAIVAGVIDAGTATVDAYDQRSKYGVHALADGLMWTELPEFTNQGAFASQRTIVEKRESLVRTLAAYASLYRYLQTPSSQDTFMSAYSAAMGKPSTTEATALWDFIQRYKPFAKDLIISEERVDYIQKLNVAVKTQKTILPYDRVADMSLARDAIKLLG